MADKKDLVKEYGSYSWDENGSHVVYDSRNPRRGAPSKDLGTSAGADKAANVLNDLNRSASVARNQMGVWRGVTPGNGQNTYAQQGIQGIMDLKGMKNGADMIVYDTEILGTAPMHRTKKNNLDFYAPTEIGFRHVKMVNGILETQEKSLSMLLQPTQDTYKRLEGLINGISNGQWAGMTDDVRRTLSDLTLYSGDANKLFSTVQKNGRRITSVNRQAREAHPLKGSVLSSSENIAAMRQGLENLRDNGTTPEHAILEMNSFMRGMQDTRFAGYNVYSFDQPMMMDYLNNGIGKHEPDSKVGKALDRLKTSMNFNQVDGYHAVKSLYRDNYSRYGENITLESMKNVFGMKGTGQSHHALSDVNVTIEQLNRLLKDPSLDKVLQGGGTKGTPYGRFNSSPIKAGDRLFGIAGMSSQKAGAYDGVYRKKDGKLHSAYDMKPNPVYRNATYEVKRFYDGLKIDGKKQYGVELYNETDDLTHTIFRNSMGELQSAIHGHFEYIEKKAPKHDTAARIQNEDRGLRRWRKMFSTESGGGIKLTNRMYQALDIQERFEKQGKLSVDSYMEKGMSRKEAERKVARNQGRVNSLIVNQDMSNTDEFVRDFHTIKGRLQDEAPWIEGFVDELGKSKLAGTSEAQMRAQSLALSEFGSLMDKNFGENTQQRRLPNNGRALALNIDGEQSYLNVSSADSVKTSLYGHLYKGHVGKPNMGTLKKRYRDLLMQLKSYDAMSAKQFEQFYKGMDGVRHDSSFDNLLNELSNAVVQARENNSLNGSLKSIGVENPTRVMGGKTSGRKSRMNAGEHLFPGMVQQAIDGTAPYARISGGSNLSLSGSALELIENHDKAVQEMLGRNNLNGSNVKSARSSLAALTQAYERQGLHVQLRFNGQTNGLQMVLADKNVAESLLNGSISNIMKSNNTAVIDLPHINPNGTISRGAQNRVARLKAEKKRGTNGYNFVTGFDEITQSLIRSASTVQNMMASAEADGTKGVMNSVHSHLNRTARVAMQNLSMNNKYANPRDKDNMFEVRSNAANYIRGGAIDVSEFADEWYTGYYNSASQKKRDLMGLKSPDKVRKAAGEAYEPFVQHMGMQAERIFQREVDGMVNERYGLNLGMHSVKDTHVANYLRSNLDIRDLIAFGNYNPMARENIMKTVNYASMEEESVRKKLKAEGFSNGEIERMVKRGVVTNKALDVMEEYQGQGKLSYLNMRTAYMNDKQLAERVEEVRQSFVQESIQAKKDGNIERHKELEGYLKHLNNPEKISTYDGMMLMADDAARAFESTREKRIKLSPGAELTEEMKQALTMGAMINGQELDLSKDINLKKMIDLNNVQYFSQDGKPRKNITVSEIIKEDLSHMDDAGNPVFTRKSTVDKTFDKWNVDNMKIKGWNAEDRTLILEERVQSMNTTKFITEGGHRVTGTMLPGEVISALAGAPKGERVHAILPSFETSKGMMGTELQKYVALAVDEAKAQLDGDVKNGKLTVGSMEKNAALERINEIFQKSFGIKDKSLSYVDKGAIVLDKDIGKSGKNIDASLASVSRFLQGVDEELGTNFHSGGHVYGNLGIGRQDVYDWENGVGLTAEHRGGLVKYGRKEVDMITTRANQTLGEGSSVVGWLKDHMSAVAQAQSRDVKQTSEALIRTSVEGANITPGEGDVVIRTTGKAFDVEDPMGRQTGRITKDGVREVSMHALNDIPGITAKNVVTVAEDYAKTIVDFGRMDGQFSDGKTFQQAIRDNGGTALFELPGEAGTFSRKYVRMTDYGDITQTGAGDRPILKEIQKIEQQIWRTSKEYQNLGPGSDQKQGDLVKRMDGLIEQHEQKVAHMVSSARDEGIMKTFGSAQMDMSGRFRLQGANPFASYEQNKAGEWVQKQNARYQEGAFYVGKNRFKEMIGGAEAEIAQVLGIENVGKTTVADLVKTNAGRTIVQDEIVQQMLANKEGKGLYGFVGRYPTIKQSTLQALEIKIDGSIPDDDRGGRMAAGTANNMKADNDGDFGSSVLAHYKSEDRMIIHEELRKMQAVEAEAGRRSGSAILQELTEDISSVAKQMNVTVGSLEKEYNLARKISEENRSTAQSKLVNLFNRIESAQSATDALETREARLGKSFVGIIDNTRDKVLSLASATIDTLQSNGRMDSTVGANYRNIIEKTTAAFSQDLISSKKFNVEKEIERFMSGDESLTRESATKLAHSAINERHIKIDEMNQALLNLTSENREVFERHNAEIGLFTDQKEMSHALDMIQDVQTWNARSRGAQNSSLRMGISEGQNAEQVKTLLTGQGDAIVPTATNRKLMEVAPEATQRVMGDSMRSWENSLVQGFDSAQDTSDGLVSSLGKRATDSGHMLSGATVADEASVKLRDVVGKFTPKNIHGGGFAGGAVAFGAMWATSAMVRSGPTPEGLREQTQQAPAPVPKQALQTPTARITENNGEHINIRVSAKNAQNMSEQEVAALVHQEIGAMTTMRMDTTLNVNDNTQNIDQQWLQGVVASAIDKGFVN